MQGHFIQPVKKRSFQSQSSVTVRSSSRDNVMKVFIMRGGCGFSEASSMILVLLPSREGKRWQIFVI